MSNENISNFSYAVRSLTGNIVREISVGIFRHAVRAGFAFLKDNVRGRYFTGVELLSPHATFFRMFVIQKYRNDLSVLGGYVEGHLHSPVLEKEAISKYLSFTFENYRFILVVDKPTRSGDNYRANIYSSNRDIGRFKRLMDMYAQWVRTQYINTIMTPVYDSSEDTAGWSAEDETYPDLEMMPIHSEVRVKLNTFIHRTQTSWNNPDVTCNIGIALIGEKGTAKTHIAKGIARALSTFIYEYRDVIPKKKLERIRNTRADKTVTIFDEMDSLAGFRIRIDADTDPDKINTGDILRFFNRIEGKSYCLIGTTNYPDRIDDAFFRYGRFSETLEVGKVDNLGIHYFFHKHHPELDLTGIVFPEYTAGQIYSVWDSIYSPEGRRDALVNGYIVFNGDRVAI